MPNASVSRTLALVALLAALGPAGPASAVLGVFEGEDRDRDDGDCWDGWMTAASDPQASGGEVLLYPGTGCSAEWDRVLGGVEVGYRFSVKSVLVPGGVPTCVEWEVFFDGASLGRTAAHCATDGRSTAEPATPQDVRPVPPGSHTIRVTAHVTPASADPRVDYVRPQATI